MATKKTARAPGYYSPRLDYWVQFETFDVWEAALMMKGIEPQLEAELPDWADSDISHELRMLMSAVRAGVVTGHFDAAAGPKWTTQISVSSFIDWLRPRGYKWLADGLDAARAKLAPRSSHAASNAPGGQGSPVSVVQPVPIPTGPLALTTTEVAESFNGLRGWSAARWKKALGDKPVWLKKCVLAPGSRGVLQTRWDPVAIGAALLMRDHSLKPNTVRARFQTRDPLKPWLDGWKTYEADHFDTA